MTDEWREYAAAYALGALDGDTLREFEAHLAGCAACREAVSEHRRTVEALALRAPAVAPPPELRDRVLRAARESTSPGTSEPERSGRPGPAIEPPRRARGGKGAPGLRRFAPWLAAAAGAAFAIWAGLAARRSETTAEGLRAEIADARERIATLETERAVRDSMLAALAGPGVRSATLTTSGANEPRVRLFWNEGADRVLVTAFDLPPAPTGRTYQLWGLAPGVDPVSLGTFDTAADGRAIVLRPVPPGAAYAQSAVTEEPAGGSPQPTTQPFLVGPWSAAGP